MVATTVTTARLYRRRRLAALLALTVIVLTPPAMAGRWAGAEEGEAGRDRTYIVQPGDTLWSIARELAPTGDVRALVDRLADRNGGAAVQAGQRLTLP